jgi:PKD repeat protein
MNGLSLPNRATDMKRTTTLLTCSAALFISACSVHQTGAPPLTGPSELALSVAMSASPDTISQDGRSNSTVTVSARDAAARALSGVTFRLDMVVDNQLGDYGTLSARSVTTGADGRASVVYTAPVAPPNGSSAGSCSESAGAGTTAGRCVQITATAVGSDYSGASTHSVVIHLTPTSVITPPSSIPVASFVVVPASPLANSPAQFDGSKSCPGTDGSGNCASNGTIVGYSWNFGDGGTASGQRASHSFAAEGNYPVTLTVTNDLSLQASFTQVVTVGAGAVPTPSFIFSPTQPAPGDPVFFDATLSKPGAGHTIVHYVWNWGDGQPFGDSSSPTATHTYKAAGTYVVTLTVGDDSSQTASITGSVKVAVPGP